MSFANLGTVDPIISDVDWSFELTLELMNGDPYYLNASDIITLEFKSRISGDAFVIAPAGQTLTTEGGLTLTSEDGTALTTEQGYIEFGDGLNIVDVDVPAIYWSDKSPGPYSVEIVKTDTSGRRILLAIFRVTIFPGNSGAGFGDLPQGYDCCYNSEVFACTGDGVKIIYSTPPMGYNGWSPLLSFVSNGASGPGLYVTDWTGGQGTKPAVPVFVCALTAAEITYDDSVTNLGATNVQAAIVALWENQGNVPADLTTESGLDLTTEAGQKITV